MRIKHINVRRYGPMPPFDKEHLGNFTVIHGPNEFGKTLLIDAIVRLLFKKQLKQNHRRRFGNMNRVAESPEGYVVIDTRGREVKLGPEETLASVTSMQITPDDFRNVFVVRDSELGIRDEGSYYTHVTERLTGIRTEEITRIVAALQKAGRLRSATPESALSNSVDHDKIGDKVKDLEALLPDIETLRDELVAQSFDGPRPKRCRDTESHPHHGAIVKADRRIQALPWF